MHLALVLFASAISTIAVASPTEIANARQAVLYQLKDPDSARFRDEFSMAKTHTRAVCGQVNSKNSFGGYTGFHRFIVGNNKLSNASYVKLEPIEEGPDARIFTVFWQVYCLPEERKK